MKVKTRKVLNLKTIIIILVAIYFVGIAAGIFFISFAESSMHYNELMAETWNKAAEYLDRRVVSVKRNVNIGTVYDTEGTVLYRFERYDFYAFGVNYDDINRGYLGSINEGKEVMDIYWFALKKDTNTYTCLRITAVPLVEDGEIIGGLFYIYDLQNILEITIGYCGIFTFFYIVVSLLLIVRNKNIRKSQISQKNYIDNVTHELKSPVASVKALTEALTDNIAEEDRNIYYGMILKEVNKQERMINEILTLSRLQNGRIAFESEKIDSEELFKGIFDKYISLCDLLDINFNIDDSIKNLPALRTSPEAINNIMDIILSNAIKYFDSDVRNIDFSAEVKNKKVVFCLRDNGIGISAEDLPHICEKFYRGKNALSYTGSGIGMATLAEIVKQIHEKMWIESTEGVGTKIYFTLNIA